MEPKGIVLDRTTRKLIVFLAAAGAIPVTVNYYDILRQDKMDMSIYRPGCELENTNGTNEVEICPAPDAGVTRVINYICVHDSDAGSETVTIAIDDSGTNHTQVVMTLATTESMVWTPESGWKVVT